MHRRTDAAHTELAVSSVRPLWNGVGFITAGASGLLVSLEGTALALLLFGWVWALKGMGMGDLKLAAGVGAWSRARSVCHGVRYDWHCGRDYGSLLCRSPWVPGQEVLKRR